MLRAVAALFGRGARPDPTQLDLSLEMTPRTPDELLGRLRAHGLRRIDRCVLTRNRRVIMSWRGSALRIHEAFLGAPDEIHRAVATFVEARNPLARRAARRMVAAYPLPDPPAGHPRRRPERARTADTDRARRLAAWHGRYNHEYFGGALGEVRLRVSRRMRSRLGHYTPRGTLSGEAEIAISSRHLRRDGLADTLHTLLHEMVHQWQDETGRPVDHGPAFRAKARELGIAPTARRATVPAAEAPPRLESPRTRDDLSPARHRPSPPANAPRPVRHR